MAISFVASASASANSVTIPTHQVGDVIIIAAYRFGSNSDSTVPSDYQRLGEFGSNSQNIVMGFRVAQTTSETSGTWTNATHCVCALYRPSAGDFFAPIGRLSTGSSASSSTLAINYTLQIPTNISGTWYMLAAMTNATDSSIDTAPSGWVTRETILTGGTGEIVFADTDGAPGSVPNLSYSIGGTAAAYRAIGAPLTYFANWPSGGSGGVPLIGAGGLVY